MRQFLAVALSVGVLSTVAVSIPAVSEPPTLQFTFKPLAYLGDAAPNGGEFFFDFEPYSINNLGNVGFGADLRVAGEEIGEGVFIRTRRGQLVEVARAGTPTPEGDTVFGPGFLEKTPLNNRGDLAFTFLREPVTDVSGVNAGVYKFTRRTGRVTPIIVPGDPAAGGGEFAGAASSASLNNRGDVAFAGIVTDADIDPDTPPGIDGLGVGVFVRDRAGRLASVLRPGDPAPGGGSFDFADQPSINDRGDVAFAAHVDRDECINEFRGNLFPLFCAESVYLKIRKGKVLSIAHQGDPAPGGGYYRYASRPLINNRGDVVFFGDLTPPPAAFESFAAFLFTDGEVIPIARPGDALPGGGEVVSVGASSGTRGINERGDVTFTTSLLRDGRLETGLYLWMDGTLQLVAKTGTEIPGLGEIVQLQPPDLVGEAEFPWTGGAINDRRQIFFTAAVDDGEGDSLLGVLLVANPGRRGKIW